MNISRRQRDDWNEQGFFLLRGFANETILTQMVDRVNVLARLIADGEPRPDLIAQEEARLSAQPEPADRLSKLFRVMRTEPVFRSFGTESELLAILADLLGPDVDCFLSQFIFKHPGALGQPWHQDNFYFRLEPPMQVGVWLACSEATLENGPLWVAPGSHRESIHDVVADQRPGANPGYVAIVDADVSGALPVLMEPGDLLVFHSHLRHMSTDNESDRTRAAMVYHYASADTIGGRQFNQDWVEVLRGGEVVEVSEDPVPVSGRN